MNQSEPKQQRLAIFTRLEPKTRWGKFFLSLAAILVYIVSFPPLYNQTGSEVAVLYIIPVLLIARFSGKRWGVLAGLLSLPLNMVLFIVVGEPIISDAGIINSGLVVGSMALVLIGFIMGQLYDMLEKLTRERMAESVAHKMLQEEIEQRQQAEVELQHHSRELSRNNQIITALSQVATSIETSADPKSVTETMGRELKALGIDSFIGLLETEDPAFVVYYLSANPSLLTRIEKLTGISVHGFRLTPERYPLFDDIVEQKQAVFIEDMVSMMPAVLPHILKKFIKLILQAGNIQPNTHAIALPLIIKERIMGVLSLWSPDLQETDIPATMIFANQVAIAFENAHLLESERRLIGRLEALSQVGAHLSTNLELQPILETVLEHTLNQIPARDADMFLYDGEQLSFGASLWAGKGFRKKPFAEPRPNGLTYTVARSGEGIVIPVANQHPLYRGQPWGGSIASFPLRAGKRVWGVMNVAFDQPNYWLEEDLRIIQLLADHAASAIRNARLHEQGRQLSHTLEQMVALRTAELTQQYNRQTALAALEPGVTDFGDLQTLLGQIVDVIKENLPANGGGSIILWEAQADRFIVSASNMPGETSQNAFSRRHQEEGPTRWIVDHGQPLIVSDVRDDPLGANPMLAELGLYAYAGLPLLAHGELLGILYAFDTEPRTYTPEDIAFLIALANRAATVISRVHLYKQLQTMNDELRRANRMKDEFLSSMSHELRTPLNTILGLSEALQEEVFEDMSERQRKSLQYIEESGHQLLALINDILDFAKLEADHLQLEMNLMSVASICQASIGLIEQTARQKTIQVTLTVDEAVTTLLADERRLKQMMNNLLSNAVKFTPEAGEVGLDVTGDAAEQFVHFTVWDTGIGISAVDMERLFAPFVQLDGALSRLYPGTGLGLALVQRLAHLHGGYMSVSSEVGQGSRFTLSLPWKEGATTLEKEKLLLKGRE
jgi:signal transduction histidine kinase